MIKLVFNITYPKYDRYQRGLASMVYNFSHKETSATRANKFAGSGIKNENMSNKELAEKLHKPIIRKFLKNESTHTFYRQYFEC